MARIVISFKETLKEDMYLYNLVQKNACGSISFYLKRVLRQLYKDMGEYEFEYEIISETQSDDDCIIIKK